MKIFFANGTQTKYLNELEYANNLLYANIYLTNFIVAIDID
jgi:glutamine cyclotransferase